MSTLVPLALFVAGVALVVFFSERLVEGAVGTSLAFGVSAFMVSVVFIGFDPENLAVGAVGSYEGAAGVALGTVVGSAMVAVAFAFGVTALLAPMDFSEVPRRILAVPVLAVVLLGAAARDGMLSRADGGVLLLAFFASLVYLWRLTRGGLDVRPTGEVGEVLDKEEEGRRVPRWKAVGLLVFSLAGVLVGSELVVRGSRGIVEWLGLSETFFGMTLLAFVVSVEELARELPAALKGRPDLAFGNVVGSVLAFFLFNAGVIALVRPVPVSGEVTGFYLPVALVTVAVVSLFMLKRRVGRVAGAVLVGLYLVFLVGGWPGLLDI